MSLMTKEEFLNNLTIVKKLCDWKNVRHLALVTAHTNLESPLSGSRIVKIPFLPMIPSGSMKVWEFGVFVKEVSTKSFILLFSSVLKANPSVTDYLRIYQDLRLFGFFYFKFFVFLFFIYYGFNFTFTTCWASLGNILKNVGCFKISNINLACCLVIKSKSLKLSFGFVFTS